MSWFATVATNLAYQGVYQGAYQLSRYGSSAIAGAVGYGLLDNTVTNFTAMGRALLGAPGALVGNIVGMAAAGANVRAAQSAAISTANGINQFVDVALLVYNTSAPKPSPALAQHNVVPKPPAVPVAAAAPAVAAPAVAAPAEQGPVAQAPVAPAEQAPAAAPAAAAPAAAAPAAAAPAVAAPAVAAPAADKATPAETANAARWNKISEQIIPLATTALALGATVGSFALGFGILAPVAASAVTALPDLMEAFFESAPSPSELDFSENVLMPFATNLAINGVSTVAGHIAAYKVVHLAYEGRKAAFEAAGKTVNFILPSPLHGVFPTIGRAVGTMDAGRYAMSEKVIAGAVATGAQTKATVATGLTAINAVVNNQLEKNPEDKTWANTAYKVVVVFGGVAAGGAMFLVAPEVAAVTFGAGMIGAAAPFLRWVKGMTASNSKPKPAVVAEAKPAVVAEAKPAVVAEAVKFDPAEWVAPPVDDKAVAKNDAAAPKASDEAQPEGGVNPPVETAKSETVPLPLAYSAVFNPGVSFDSEEAQRFLNEVAVGLGNVLAASYHEDQEPASGELGQDLSTSLNASFLNASFLKASFLNASVVVES